MLAFVSPVLAAPPASQLLLECQHEDPDECQVSEWHPPLTITPVKPQRGILSYAYARVVTPNALVYGHPADALANYSPKRTLGVGFIFVSVSGKTTYQGHDFFEINPGEFVAASDLEFVTPSSFRGAFFAAPPALPFGWVIRGDRLRAAPGAPADPTLGVPTIGRYQPITIYAVQHVGEWDWYMVGPDQWIEQRNVARVNPQPAGGGLSGRWIEVNLYEQTVAAFENGQLVYATLASTGARAWPTRAGLFQIWARQDYGRQTGAYRKDKSDYYFLEDVPWVMYFDGDISLHGAYWHDSFGFRKSHGCVNLAPGDAKWFFSWASEGTPVYVYNSAPGGSP
ncbi:MAG: L,D-transpeptidase [Anaerolineales bacterium]